MPSDLINAIDAAPGGMWIETFRRLHLDVLARARRDAPPALTVERLAAALPVHDIADPCDGDTHRWCLAQATAILAALRDAGKEPSDG